jgi:hypothetical protein
MREAIGTVAAALEDIWDHLFITVGCCLIWLLCALLLIPGPPATVALVDVARRIRSREEITVGDYLRSIWAHFGLGWRWGLVALPVALVLGVDFRIAPDLLADWLALPARVFTGLVLALWLMLQLYAVPLLFEQVKPSVLLAQRNAAVMALRHPGYMAALALIAALLLWVSLLLIVVNLLAGPMFVAFLGVRAVRERLERETTGLRSKA